MQLCKIIYKWPWKDHCLEYLLFTSLFIKTVPKQFHQHSTPFYLLLLWSYFLSFFSHFFHSSRHLPVIFSMLFKMSIKRPTRPLLVHFSFSFSANFQKSWSKVCATSIIFLRFHFPTAHNSLAEFKNHSRFDVYYGFESSAPFIVIKKLVISIYTDSSY